MIQFYGICPVCKCNVPLEVTGRVRKHHTQAAPIACPGTHERPQRAEPATELGAPASFDYSGEDG